MILTIYCHGTGGSSAKDASKREIVNLFGNNHLGAFRIITEGPGSVGHPQKLVPRFERINAPDLDFDGAMIRKDTPRFSNDMARRWIGTAFGSGVHNNVDMVYQTIERLEVDQGSRLPEAINMLGWSRGAVTCVRIANRLWTHPRFRNIPLNILAVDPVAGPGNYDDEEIWRIPSSVKRYLATLQTDESRGFFRPIAGESLRYITDETATCVLNMPGNHSAAAKSNNPIGRIVFNLAYRFLSMCGTPVEGMRRYRLTAQQVWDLYEGVLTGNTSVNKTTWREYIQGGTYDRANERRYHSPHDGDDVLPNAHAIAVFKRSYQFTWTPDILMDAPTDVSLARKREERKFARLNQGEALVV